MCYAYCFAVGTVKIGLTFGRKLPLMTVGLPVFSCTASVLPINLRSSSVFTIGTNVTTRWNVASQLLVRSGQVSNWLTPKLALSFPAWIKVHLNKELANPAMHATPLPALRAVQGVSSVAPLVRRG